MGENLLLEEEEGLGVCGVHEERLERLPVELVQAYSFLQHEEMMFHLLLFQKGFRATRPSADLRRPYTPLSIRLFYYPFLASSVRCIIVCC